MATAGFCVRSFRLLFLVYFVFQMFPSICIAQRLLGLYAADTNAHTQPNGRLNVKAHIPVEIILVGTDLRDRCEIFLTQNNASCKNVRRTQTFVSDPVNSSTSARVEIELDLLDRLQYICLKEHTSDQYIHQGAEEWLTIKTFTEKEENKYFMPFWLQISICCVLLVLSGLFSGLNLGLMSLDQTELKIIGKVGSDNEKQWAKRIGPLRKRGNLLLCTLLLGNVMVNSTFTILFDNMTNGIIAVVSSTIGIVIFGEIIPQAICSRHGLAVGANTYWLTVLFIILTFPASFPISLVLDKILGEEMGQVYNKEKLQELIRMTADRRVLRDDEANIISGALQLTNKSVEDIMTKVEDVYMLEVNRILDFDTMTEIMHHGYTRVPVYDGEKTNIINLLNTKDLALIDPDDKTPLSTVCKFYDHKPLYVDQDVKLDAMLQEFLQGDSHMAIVQKLHNNEDHDPYYETMGVVTLEDVIEEILQREIIDEKDVVSDNRQKAPRNKRHDYEIFGAEVDRSKLPKQLAFVAFQFLTTTVEPFSDAYLARNVLMNLMKKDIVVNLSPTDPVSQKNYIYQKGVATDKFVLILQGTVEVIAGEEGMVFESGPFSYFGKEAINLVRKHASMNELKIKDYVPDFSVRALTDVQYLCINRTLYLAALRTTKMLRNSGNIAINEAFDAEFEKVSKLNTNRNSGLEGLSPLFTMSALECIKFDETTKKHSTSSLDRVTFFPPRNDPHEYLYRMRRTGSDAKDPCAGIAENFGARAIGHMKSSDGLSIPTSPLAGKRTPSTNNRKPHFLKESLEKSLENKSPTSPDFHVEGDGIDLRDVKTFLPDGHVLSSAVPETQDKVPLIVMKPAEAEQPNSNFSATGQTNYTNNKDAERVPLMNQTESTFDMSALDTSM